MKIVKIGWLLIIVLLIFTSCPNKDVRNLGFDFRNNSDRDVWIYLGVVSREFGGSLYPDTAISLVRAGRPVKIGKRYGYEYRAYKGVDTLCLFIYDADTFNTCSWGEISEKYKILKRYDLSEQDFKFLKYNITYPPDDRMKDIKMYPPYESE